MDLPVVRINQGGDDIGWGKLGSVAPLDEGGSEITLNDVQMADTVKFEIGGPFRVTIDDKKFAACLPVNFRNLRPGAAYDRVVFRTGEKPRMG